jgi:Copper transport outer membrane protein, MctB
VIDFRYHLVSIVSIFLALAVGIVLGAGPLKEDLGNTLTRELTQLRQDKTGLRADLTAAQKGIGARDTWAEAVSPTVVRGTLAGKTVAVVVAPGADGGVVKDTVATLAAAGAKVGSTTTLSDAWVDPAKRTFRNNLANQLSTLVKVPGGASSPDSLPGAVLSRAILSDSDRATSRLEPGASQALDGLRTGDLLDISPDQITPASSVVMVGGPVKGTTPEDTASRLAGYVQLARALDSGGAGAVVVTAADSSNPAVAGQLVTAVRKDGDATKGVSTVDDPGVPMGQATLAQALAEQYAGGVGQYGVAADAKAVLPEPAPR